MADQALALELGKRRELLLDRALARPVYAADTQIDDVERIRAEVAEVVVDAADEISGGAHRDPGGVVAAHRPDLGDDHQIIRIGMQRLADQMIGDVRAVEIAGVDVIDPACHRFAQHGQGGVAILGRPPNTPGPASCIAP